MKKIVIMPGGFHPFHAGHFALYQSAKKAFPDADVYVAATNDQSERPFPFALKEKLAKLAGVEPGHFIQVKSPFQAKEITQNYNPEQDVLVFVRSEKDRNEQPKPGGTKKDGSPAYFQPWTGKNLQPFSKHAYMAYLPTVEFGPGITSATQIRKAWPTLNDKRKTALVMSLYPASQKNPKLAQNVVGMFDQVMGDQQGVAETTLRDKQDLEAKRKTLQDLEREPGADQEAIRQRKLDLEKEARTKGVAEQLRMPSVTELSNVVLKQIQKVAESRYPNLIEKQEEFIKFATNALVYEDKQDDEQVINMTESQDYLEEK